ncbi:MAG: NAD(P)-dependent oxidoreductase, partial [Anaerococcus vaginalis]|uniref:NAD(P)-dependent oxidoreductase n=1 Tax=Anaerococcus vaginalis TaxID=33037 RepID=UPI002906BF3D|nr:NAD(P)-dependent oxidoreductase [Anaerococcus vaginalis]
EISNKKVGLVGFGAVGKEIAKRLDVFGAEISFYDPYVEKCDKYIKKDLKDIFKDSDIISLHLPVNSETTNMIDKDLLDLIKPKSVLINSSRSKVVNNDDLMKLIEDKDVEVILDVLPEEPPKRSDIEFLKNKNVTLTPHIAGATYQVTNHQADILNESIKKYYKNENLEKIVYNKEIL